MVYPFKRDKEISDPPLPNKKSQDASTRESNQARFDAYIDSENIKSLNSNSKSEIRRDKGDTSNDTSNSSNSLARKLPPLWINPLFVSSIKNEMIPKIPYALGLIGSAFIGMIFQPPVVPVLKHLPYAANAFMQVMKAEEQPIRGGTNAQMERLKEMDSISKEQYYLALEQNRQLRRLKAQGNSTYNSKPSQGLSVPENGNKEQKLPPFSPTKADQAIISEFMADKERLQLLCDSFILMAHTLPNVLRDHAVKARKEPRFEMGMVGFGGMKKDFETPLAGPQAPTTAGQFDNAVQSQFDNNTCKSFKPVGLLGLYAKWAWFKF